MALQRRKTTASEPASAPVDPEFGSILYVEDDDTNWHVANLALTKNFRLVRAQNAQEAMELLAKTPFDLVLMDVELAGSDLNVSQP
jgi:CheY-like chemotaxis protein